METKTIYEWLKECLYIRRNVAWQGGGGTLRFLQIKWGIERQTGMSNDAFYNWLDRIERLGNKN